MCLVLRNVQKLISAPAATRRVSSVLAAHPGSMPGRAPCNQGGLRAPAAGWFTTLCDRHRPTRRPTCLRAPRQHLLPCAVSNSLTLGSHSGPANDLQQDPHVPDQHKYVGMAGFEPAASCSQSRRANQAAPHPAGQPKLTSSAAPGQPHARLPLDQYHGLSPVGPNASGTTS
jgi:hypothetical protein